MRTLHSTLIVALLGMPSTAFGAGPEPEEDKTGPTTIYVTLPPRPAPFDPEILARVRADLEGLKEGSTEEGAKPEDGHNDDH